MRGAAILAIDTGAEKITNDLLDLVPIDYAAERASARPRHDPGPWTRRPRYESGPAAPRLPIAVGPAHHETAAFA